MSEQLSNASSPWTGEANGDVLDPVHSPTRRIRRIGEHTVVVLLGLMALAIAVGSWPVWVGVAEGYRATAARPGIERYARLRGWAVGEPQAKAASRYAPRPEAYGVGGPSFLEEILGHEDLGSGNAEGRPAVSRGRIDVLDRADDDGTVVLEIDPTVTMLVAKDIGRWLLVAIQQGERAQYGWVRRHDILILP